MFSSAPNPQQYTSIAMPAETNWPGLMVWGTFRAKHRRVRQRIYRRTFDGLYGGTYWVIEDVTWRARMRLADLRDASRSPGDPA